MGSCLPADCYLNQSVHIVAALQEQAVQTVTSVGRVSRVDDQAASCGAGIHAVGVPQGNEILHMKLPAAIPW